MALEALPLVGMVVNLIMEDKKRLQKALDALSLLGVVVAVQLSKFQSHVLEAGLVGYLSPGALLERV